MMSGNGDMIADYRMNNIPAGVVALRDDRIKKSWTAAVESFLLAPVPVTQSLYAAVMQGTLEPKGLPEVPKALPEVPKALPEILKALLAVPKAFPEIPMVNVSWLDAIHFCNLFSRYSGLQSCYSIIEADDEMIVEWDRRANGFRLPTEAEWQYACKAGTSEYRYGELDAIAWYRDNSHGRLHEAAQKLPNAWQLYDMLGNVWEWCWDLYDTEVYGSYRVFRGGSWAEEGRGCGATCRRRSHPTFRIDDLGFRLARTL
ncbi:formylglycine-generating enzyme family protein [Paenibacillus fonticola]|uniref:formylglycine-generating enzyme family protein n=1 Tax=Paenibacillus fonticola TaxID=379896 RepID=UPI000380BE4B|nr:SUMF1/EgtB/PvdO family nonheme iron enzyme [Paenibacillus fonticola]